jgi:lipoate-protein ligase B
MRGVIGNSMTIECDRHGTRQPTLTWALWPRMDYGRALALQHVIHRARARDAIPNTLLVMEHSPTVTLGRRGSLADLRGGPGALAAHGVALYRVGRGGHATYHGPGQLVAYPVCDLRHLGLGARRFVAVLERAIAQVLAALGIEATVGGVTPGVWVGSRKIAALGIEILDGITRHGVALNVSGAPWPLDLLVPCGAADQRTTSVEALGVAVPDPAAIAAALAAATASMLGLTAHRVEPNDLIAASRSVTVSARTVGLAGVG